MYYFSRFATQNLGVPIVHEDYVIDFLPETYLTIFGKAWPNL